jgi:hypothetical protein
MTQQESKGSAVRTVKEWSSEELVDCIKKQLQTDRNLDFLLEINTRELKVLAGCIGERMNRLESLSTYRRQVFMV